jgi:hypothetical protein
MPNLIARSYINLGFQNIPEIDLIIPTTQIIKTIKRYRMYIIELRIGPIIGKSLIIRLMIYIAAYPIMKITKKDIER